MNGLTDDQKGLVSGIVGYLKNDKKATTVTPKVEKFLSKVTEQAKKDGVAVVTTAVPISEGEKKKLASSLQSVLGREVSVVNDVKPEVIGGMRIQVADWVVDTTVSNELARMAGLLMG